MSKEKEMQSKTGWANIEFAASFDESKGKSNDAVKSREEKSKHAAEKDLKFMTAEEYMEKQDLED